VVTIKRLKEILLDWRERPTIILAILVFVIGGIAYAYRIRLGIGFNDTGFYFSSGSKYLLGDIPFKDENLWALRWFDIFLALIMKILPDTGIVLSLRITETFFHLLAFFLIGRWAIMKGRNPFLVPIAVFCVLFYNEYAMYDISFYTLPVSFTVIGIAILMEALDKKDNLKLRAAASLFFFLGVFCTLPLAFLHFLLITFILILLLRNKYPSFTFAVTTVAYVCLIAFLYMKYGTLSHKFYLSGFFLISLIYAVTLLYSLKQITIDTSSAKIILHVSSGVFLLLAGTLIIFGVFGLLEHLIDSINEMVTLTGYHKPRIEVLSKSVTPFVPSSALFFSIAGALFLISEYSERNSSTRFEVKYFILKLFFILSTFLYWFHFSTDNFTDSLTNFFPFNLTLAIPFLFIFFTKTYRTDIQFQVFIVLLLFTSYTFIVGAVSHLGFGRASSPSGIYLLAILPLISIDISRQKNAATWTVSTFILAIPLCYGLYSSLELFRNKSYNDAPPIFLTKSFTHKKLLGIKSTPPKVNELERLLKELGAILKPGDFLMAYPNLPILYFLTDTRHPMETGWADHFAWPHNLKELFLYNMVKNKRIPEYIVWSSTRIATYIGIPPHWDPVTGNRLIPENYKIPTRYSNSMYDMFIERYYTLYRSVGLFRIYKLSTDPEYITGWPSRFSEPESITSKASDFFKEELIQLDPIKSLGMSGKFNIIEEPDSDGLTTYSLSPVELSNKTYGQIGWRFENASKYYGGTIRLEAEITTNADDSNIFIQYYDKQTKKHVRVKGLPSLIHKTPNVYVASLDIGKDAKKIDAGFYLWSKSLEEYTRIKNPKLIFLRHESVSNE
jgi:hypothetical protein